MAIETVAALLKRLRVAEGLSQQELADRAGLSVKAISAIESGVRRRPRPQTLRALSSALALSAPERALLLRTVATPPAAQLPRDIADFTGREREILLALEALVSPAGDARGPPVVAMFGRPGVGKSALAVHVAQRLRARFPDGQLYLELRGATPGLSPLEPLEGLGRLLRALGCDPARVPADVEEASGLFRSVTAGRRLLLLLDNARSAQQVRPLLPGRPTCAVVVTSRQALATLEGTRTLRLDVLPEEGALELLGRIAGVERLAADQEAALEVVRWCERLPLAVRIAGARLVAEPDRSVRELAGHLGDAARRLHELRAAELAMRASLDVSLHALSESDDDLDRAAAAAFGLLGLPDVPDIGLAAAARLLDLPDATARTLLQRLADAQLLDSQQPGRYRLHDLGRLYARQRVRDELPETERVAALTRLLGFYTATAWQATGVLRRGTWRLASADPRWTDHGLSFEDASSALAWSEAEHANLLVAMTQAAGDAGLPGELPIQLARALTSFLDLRGYWHDWLGVSEIGLGTARRMRDRVGQANALNDLASAYERLARHADAIACVEEALSTALTARLS